MSSIPDLPANATPELIASVMTHTWEKHSKNTWVCSKCWIVIETGSKSCVLITDPNELEKRKCSNVIMHNALK